MPGVLLTNPPYGERLGEEKELRPLYRMLGEVLQRSLSRLAGFCLHRQPFPGQELGVPIKNSMPLFNGKIPCRLLELDVT